LNAHTSYANFPMKATFENCLIYELIAAVCLYFIFTSVIGNDLEAKRTHRKDRNDDGWWFPCGVSVINAPEPSLLETHTHA